MGIIRRLYTRMYPKPPQSPVETHQEEAVEALAAAHRDLREAYLLRPHVEELVSHAEMIGARNGFGAMIEASMGSKRKKKKQ